MRSKSNQDTLVDLFASKCIHFESLDLLSARVNGQFVDALGPKHSMLQLQAFIDNT